VLRHLLRRNNQEAPSEFWEVENEAIATTHTHRADNSLPLLSLREEEALCYRWHEHYDIAAAEHLIGSHLHVLATIATAHRGCGVRMQELIGEGYVGLIRAASRYDPACGTRFVTYATWWVQAAIQQSIPCASHSMQRDAVDAENVTAMTPLFTRGNRQRDSVQFV
jgi:DNA-directed RNA polymerase sigma subunit (sigma70/sigma32)